MSFSQPFQDHTYPVDAGRVLSGLSRFDQTLLQEVSVDVGTDRRSVTLLLSDAVAVEVSLDPVIALAVADALVEAAATVLARPDGPIDRFRKEEARMPF